MSSLPIKTSNSSRLSGLPVSVGSTVYLAFLRARVSTPPLPVVFVWLRRYNRRRRQLRSLVFARRPLRRSARRPMSWRRRRHDPRRLLWSANFTGQRRWFPNNIRRWRVSWQMSTVSAALFVMAWSAHSNYTATTNIVLSSSNSGRSRTTTWTFWSPTKATENIHSVL